MRSRFLWQSEPHYSVQLPYQMPVPFHSPFVLPERSALLASLLRRSLAAPAALPFVLPEHAVLDAQRRWQDGQEQQRCLAKKPRQRRCLSSCLSAASTQCVGKTDKNRQDG